MISTETTTIKRTLTGLELQVGTRLPWSLYSPQGTLLLTEGTLICSEKQIESLLNIQAHYYKQVNPAPLAASKPAKDDALKVSTFVIVHTLLERLNAAFELRNQSEANSAFIRRIMQLVFDIQGVCEENPDAMLGTMQLIVEAPHGLVHPLHAALMCEVASCRMGQGPLERFPVVAAALTHDLGMYDIQQALFEQSSPLSDEQRRIINEHPQRAHDLLKQKGVTEPRWLLPILQHHERIDGSGYPAGLCGDAICRDARLLAITDSYSAMIRPRAYRDQVLPRDALREIFQQRGNTIDATLARLFIDVMGVFSPGTLVRLTRGELALITGRGDNLNQPTLAVITGPQGKRLNEPRSMTLEDSSEIKSILCIQDHAELIAMLGHIWPEMTPIPSAA
ncbi:HD-GYP domain-containing protein [Marinobacterium sediminicola]|uniref:HD-GYP domain, c-di-GMP phosphodiesterase class II (Or its inactivated variant) n=1 Tax=Marinobacterium sediminicola TaxID=518898 RepID=A0ABY1RWF3_9GAMM|nr:HD domain-containing phosphohydrolase [Marinobacterium sediminicola]ULG70366.1 HD domain-containing protein [Marinobacterium sediminicola]SMR69597.1 HD-GYP domain, c-di-GMP phosphodiesterase class II (or its inactivated variant) [Marinobacterium sediminicola]